MPRIDRAFQPSAERLEAHVLLSTGGSELAILGLPITETVTTDKTMYKVGQPVRITLTETNNTNKTVILPDIAGGGFTATHDMKLAWKSQLRTKRGGSSTLQPGQTQTIKVIWNGRPNIGAAAHASPPTGTFQIDNTLANDTVTIVIDPRHGKGATAGPTSAVPNELLTLTS